MSNLGDHTYVFIVRIWQESHDSENVDPVLRGMIEYIPSGNRRYFTDLRDMLEYMLSYLGLDWSPP